MSLGWALTPCYILGEVLVHNDCPGGRLPLLSHVLGVYPGGLSWGMVNDESDSCISESLQNVHSGIQLPWVHVSRPSV